MTHPVHPALVHFPIACWTLATIGDLASLLLDLQVWWLSGVLLAIGTISALGAMMAGLIELAKIDKNSPALRVANRHMELVMMSWSLYTISLYMRVDQSTIIEPSIAAILLSILGFIVLSISGWLGGKLVYEHGVGVSRGPLNTPTIMQ